MRPAILPILLLTAWSVFAAAPLTFEEVDTDGDGLVSADEAATVEALDFDAADVDKDGTLSIDEYDIALGKWSPPDGARPPNNLLDEDVPSPEASPAAPEAAPAPPSATSPAAPEASPAAK